MMLILCCFYLVTANLEGAMSWYAASAAAPYPLGFIHLDLDENTFVMESEAPKE